MGCTVFLPFHNKKTFFYFPCSAYFYQLWCNFRPLSRVKLHFKLVFLKKQIFVIDVTILTSIQLWLFVYIHLSCDVRRHYIENLMDTLSSISLKVMAAFLLHLLLQEIERGHQGVDHVVPPGTSFVEALSNLRSFIYLQIAAQGNS